VKVSVCRTILQQAHDQVELIADDVGIDGGAASAEEAAVHIIDDEQ